MMERIGRYQVIRDIGSGGFAAVYRALDTVLEREIALKVMFPFLAADPTYVDRFQREAKVAARLEHPNIVPIYDYGEFEGKLFLVMKLMTGGSLEEELSISRLPFDRALNITTQIAAGLDFAHGRGIVHRDVKPGNVLLDEHGTAVLGDFGLVKALSGTAVSQTLTDTITGTPAFLPPEIWNGEKASPASDIYALACLVFEMLTARRLYDAPTPPGIMLKHFQPPDLISGWPDSVPGGIQDVLKKGLAPEPKDRFPSAGEFASELAKRARDPLAKPYITPRPPLEAGGEDVATSPQQLPFLTRVRLPAWIWVLISLGAIALALVLALGGLGWGRDEPTPAAGLGPEETRATETWTPIVLADTSTPAATRTPTATSTPTPSATPTPTQVNAGPDLGSEAAAWYLDLQDNFDGYAGEWTQPEMNTNRVIFEDQGLAFIIHQASGTIWSTLPYEYSDVMVQATIHGLTIEEGGAAGIAIRVNEEGKGYLFQITGDGRYRITVDLHGMGGLLRPWAPTSVMNTGGEPNHLAVVGQGTALKFYVNGWLMDEIVHDSHVRGRVALWGGASVQSDVHLVFDDVTIWLPVATPTPTPTLPPTPSPTPTATTYSPPAPSPTRPPPTATPAPAATPTTMVIPSTPTKASRP